MRKEFSFGMFDFEIIFEKRKLATPDPTPAEIGKQLRRYVCRVTDVDAAVHELSKAFAPPKVNLRDGEIDDDNGDESRHPVPMSHVLPEDPTRDELERYFNGYAYMEPTDLVFYLFAWIQTLAEDEDVDGMPDFYFYNLGWNLPGLLKELDEGQLLALYCGLLALWERMKYPLTIDWRGSDNLLEFLSIEDGAYGELPGSHGNPTAWCNL